MDELGYSVVKKGPATDPELIEAVRRCAEASMSFAQTAAKLTTERHPLTRSAIGGIAHRNGITFKSRRKGSARPRVPAEKRLKRRAPARQPTFVAPQPKPAGQSQLTGAGFGTVRALLKKPGPQCA